jgi:2-keto-4-pentenoate hydratase
MVKTRNGAFAAKMFISMTCRVNRLGEFLSIGWLFTLGSFIKITEVPMKTTFSATFSHNANVMF